MIFQTFTPWQFLLWIVALIMVSIPLVTILWGSLCTTYFRAKENHLNRVFKTVTKIFEAGTNALVKTLETKTKDDGDGKVS